MNDKVNSPKHYIGDKGHEIEETLRQFIPRYENAYVGHRVASAIEYLVRAPLKNGVEDLRKAVKNIELAIEGYPTEITIVKLFANNEEVEEWEVEELELEDER